MILIQLMSTIQKLFLIQLLILIVKKEQFQMTHLTNPQKGNF